MNLLLIALLFTLIPMCMCASDCYCVTVAEKPMKMRELHSMDSEDCNGSWKCERGFVLILQPQDDTMRSFYVLILNRTDDSPEIRSSITAMVGFTSTDPKTRGQKVKIKFEITPYDITLVKDHTRQRNETWCTEDISITEQFIAVHQGTMDETLMLGLKCTFHHFLRRPVIMQASHSAMRVESSPFILFTGGLYEIAGSSPSTTSGSIGISNESTSRPVKTTMRQAPANEAKSKLKKEQLMKLLILTEAGLLFLLLVIHITIFVVSRSKILQKQSKRR